MSATFKATKNLQKKFASFSFASFQNWSKNRFCRTRRKRLNIWSFTVNKFCPSFVPLCSTTFLTWKKWAAKVLNSFAEPCPWRFTSMGLQAVDQNNFPPTKENQDCVYQGNRWDLVGLDIDFVSWSRYKIFSLWMRMRLGLAFIRSSCQTTSAFPQPKLSLHDRPINLLKF